MKNAFGINAKTGELDSNKFKVKVLSEELNRKSEEKDKIFSEIQKSVFPPKWLTYVTIICGIAGMIILALLLENLAEGELADAYQKYGWVFYVGGACIVFTVAMIVYYTRKTVKTYNKPAVREIIADGEVLIKRCYEELGVPPSADDIDIFCYYYKIRNDKIKKAKLDYKYINGDHKIFRDGENLYIANDKTVFAFPVSKFTEIVAVKKRATFDSWNKDVPYSNKLYRYYKVRYKNGTYFAKTYSLRFSESGEEYEIVIPNYELQTLQKYLSLSVIQL